MLRTYSVSYTVTRWKKKVAIALVILFLPIFIIIAIVVTMTQSVYMEADETNIYLEVVEEVGSENGVNIYY